MIIFDETTDGSKFIFVATPRAASKSVVKALVKSGGLFVGFHHDVPDQVPKNKKWPIYAICRDPRTQMESWFKHTYYRHKMPFKSFLKFYSEGFYIPNLNPYKYIADKIFRFELGVPHILEAMKVNTEFLEIPHEHKSTDEVDDKIVWDEEAYEIFNNRFAEEIYFHEGLKNG